MNNDQKLTIALAQLARSSKPNWNQFLAEYRVYVDELLVQLVSSPRETLEVAQGRARHAREFLKRLEECETTADQISKRTN